LPVPEAPEEMATRDESLAFAVQAQLGDDAVTPMEPVPLVAGIVAEVALSV